ncbi:hypothetical protein C9374_001055 [Naegleria lovaniensis]|uniref:Uncharacterized protein n=1 Tax=Naegleria lovaniensis TaxID=51637 RepID=A0AA88GSR9_NAELO|nr:uncharacterized protein C9374_001055 [Naegleria lovaniensis]KAG2388205.1 hypothetical protein C9374_001055 [Naegleria lovaniensis]
MPSFSWLKIKNSGQEADSAMIESLEETPVSQWSSKQLTQFLRDNKKKIELEKKDIKKLRTERWNGLSMLSAKVEDLEKLGLASGSARALYTLIHELIDTQIQKNILPSKNRISVNVNSASSDISTSDSNIGSSSSTNNNFTVISNNNSSSSTSGQNGQVLLMNGSDISGKHNSLEMFGTSPNSTMKQHQLNYIQTIIQQQQGKLLVPNLREEDIEQTGGGTSSNTTTTTTTTTNSAVTTNGGKSSSSSNITNLAAIPAEDDIRLAHDLNNPGEIAPPLVEASSGRKSAGGGLQILTIASASTSNASAPESAVKDCPAWMVDQLTAQQKQAFENAIEKVQNLKYPIKPELIDVLAQDLVIVDRFKYKFLNPDRLKQRGDGGKHGTFLKVKLVITEMDTEVFHRICRRFANTFSSTVKNSRWGMFHTALIIGPWYLEWNDSSLSTVRKKSSSKAVFAVDIARIEGQREVNEAIDSVAQLCTVWNGYKLYENDSCNCQHFVIDMLEYLGLGDNFENILERYPPLAEYITKLKKKGVCDMAYYVDDRIAKAIKESPQTSRALKELVKNKKVKFTSHTLLDEFVSFIKQNFPLFMTNREQEYELLKAFDRAFWLRSQSSQTEDDETVQPLIDIHTNECKCPFNKNGQPITEVNNSIVGIDYDVGNYTTPYPKSSLNA